LYGYVLNDPVNLSDAPGLMLGDGYGAEAAQYWAGMATDPNSNALQSGFAYGMGMMASLWTPDTSHLTAMTLTFGRAGTGLASASGRRVFGGLFAGGAGAGGATYLTSGGDVNKSLNAAAYTSLTGGAAAFSELRHLHWAVRSGATGVGSYWLGTMEDPCQSITVAGTLINAGASLIPGGSSELLEGMPAGVRELHQLKYELGAGVIGNSAP
jgi:hypothetical protein